MLDCVSTPSAHLIMQLLANSPDMTQSIASALATLLRAGDCLALSGPLGAGKTCFAQGVARGLGIEEVVSSPSFVLAKQYHGEPGFLHVDAYRLGSPEEFWDLGLGEQLEDCVSLVEWAENVDGGLPEEALRLAIAHAGGNTRTLSFSGREARWCDTLQRFQEMLAAEGSLGDSG